MFGLFGRGLGVRAAHCHDRLALPLKVLAQIVREVHANTVAIACTNRVVADARHILGVHLLTGRTTHLRHRLLGSGEGHVHLGRLRSVRSQVRDQLLLQAGHELQFLHLLARNRVS